MVDHGNLLSHPTQPVVSLKGLTREAVLKAIAEYEELGQDAFLDKYGFHPARSYLLVHDGKRYDSKAIVGAAHGYLPGRRPAPANKFSGGEARLGSLLRNLGFILQVGDDLTPERLVQILGKLNVNRQNGIPALYQPITLLWAFSRARRSEPRVISWAETDHQVRALLDSYGREREGSRVFYPVAALYNAGLWELDADPETVPSAHGSVPQRWFADHQPDGGLVEPVHDLLRESPETLDAAVKVLVDRYFTDPDDSPAPLLSHLGLFEPGRDSVMEGASFNDRAAEYRRRCERADRYWLERDSKRADRTASVPIRSDDAREAVLLRSEGRCENPVCEGDIKDRTDKGAPILEVDHIDDLALGGDDAPVQMIALCPNCHATKTRGSTRKALKPTLLAAARARHDRLVRQSATSTPPSPT